MSADLIYAMKEFNGKLYIGGWEAGQGISPWDRIACYNDTSWSDIGFGPSNPVLALEVFDSSLYAGGRFNYMGPGDSVFCGMIARYDATLIQDTTAIVELKKNISEIKIYPNPVSEQLTVISEQLINTIEIKDVLGRIIYSAQTNSQLSIINCQLFLSGIYFIKVQMHNGTVVIKKFVKE